MMILSTAIAIAHLGGAARPNVILVLVDDLGWQDTSLRFGLSSKVIGRHFRTPHLEALARNGVQVHQAYSSATVCTPSRVALLTGRSPARTGITNWVRDGRDTDGPHPRITLPEWEARGWQPSFGTTLPSAFRSAGYTTIEVGKAHFGAAGTLGERPTNLGFDRSIAGSAAGNPNSFYGLQNFASKKANSDAPPDINDIRDLQAYHGKDIYLDEAMTKEAIKEIDSAVRNRKPFFLWFAPYVVHTPIQPNRRYLHRYRHLDPIEAAYATMVETCDASLGELMRALKRQGQLDNTVIAFTSDNGGLSNVARGGWPNLHNLPLRSGKGSAYEGGTRVPLVLSGPGVAKGKSLSKTWVTGTDLSVTLADLAGVPFEAPDGRSFAKRLSTLEDQDRGAYYVWHYPHNRGGRGPGLSPHSAIRDGDFKAIFFYAERKWELYNLANDLGETRDLSLSQAPRLQQMATLLNQELTKLNVKFPVDPKTGESITPKLTDTPVTSR